MTQLTEAMQRKHKEAQTLKNKTNKKTNKTFLLSSSPKLSHSDWKNMVLVLVSPAGRSL